MADRPILFSGSMVRAILDGRKSQTRRVVKPQPEWIDEVKVTTLNCQFVWPIGSLGQQCGAPLTKLPYGHPGDRLWVRETCRAEELPSGLDGVRYLADNEFIPIENSERASEKWVKLASYGMKKPGRVECRKVTSIHMPRWASRLLLEITDVRVERLNDISEDDALAEGTTYLELPSNALDPMKARNWYRGLWESINGPGSWDENPWVWCISFRRIDAC